MRGLYLLVASLVAAVIGATLFVAPAFFLFKEFPRDTLAVYALAVSLCVPLLLGLHWPVFGLVEHFRQRRLSPLLAPVLGFVLMELVTTVLLTHYLHHRLELDLLRRNWNVYGCLGTVGLIFGAAYARRGWYASTTQTDRSPVSGRGHR